MTIALSRWAFLLMIGVTASVCTVGCSESVSKNVGDAPMSTNAIDFQSKTGKKSVEDGADPSPEVAEQRQKAEEYLKTLQTSKNSEEEHAAIVKLVEWLQGLKKSKAVKIEGSESQSSDDDAKVPAEKMSIHVICFPPTYASVEYQFKDAENIKLFDPVLFVE